MNGSCCQADAERSVFGPASQLRQSGVALPGGIPCWERTPQELLPLELHSIQELNYQVGEFFDRALYHLARGYESEAAACQATV